jgi:hypothetical protein
LALTILKRFAGSPVALLALGCGPSVQAVYEGNTRFEHCYRLDLDVTIAPSHRQACWSEYAERYTAGQTRDRLEYARRRVRALAAGDHSRPTLDLELGDASAPLSPPEAPIPTSVHAPPPPKVKLASAEPPDAGRAATDGSAPSPPVVEPPGRACARRCEGEWQECGGANCDADAGGKPGKACQGCGRDYRRCMQRCFR